MNTTSDLAQQVGVKPACTALGVSRASYYRRQRSTLSLSGAVNANRPKPPLALHDTERQMVLDILHSERFVDKAPPVIYTSLLDEGIYLCSVRTMYRILSQENEVRERRNQRRHPQYTKPELRAVKSNQVWSWDITKLKGPERGTFYHLYVILDIYSRYVVGWMVAAVELGQLAKQLIEETSIKQNVVSGQLTIHSDRGASMKSKLVSDLLIDLGIIKSHSRPKVSDDNPFSESQFKTMKYRPEFPQRFGSIEDARVFCRLFFTWYNTEHLHSGIAMLTPETLHYDQADQVIKKRSETLAAAFIANPSRFKRNPPVPKTPPKEVWINQPKQTENGLLESTEDIPVESSTLGETEVVMLESTPPRDNPVRTHQDGEPGCGSHPSAPTHEEDDQINRMIDPVMPKKTPARRAEYCI
jgi:putative transposase